MYADKKAVRKKTVLIYAIIFMIIILVSGAIYLFQLYSIPYGCNDIKIYNGCAKIDADGTINWTDGIQHAPIYYEDTKFTMGQVAATLRTLKLVQTDKLPTDVQLIEISFSRTTHSTIEKLWTTYIAYDFYTEKLYTQKSGVWYEMQENEQLNDYIMKRIEGSYWRGQSTYTGGEEFPEADFENATFRYNLYWTTIPKHEHGTNSNVQVDGFKNTEESPINSREDAVALAAKELGYDNPVAVTFYDETCGYYMVEIANDNGNGIMKKNGSSIEFVEPIFTVVMDDKGRTLEVYEGCTRTLPFWPEP